MEKSILKLEGINNFIFLFFLKLANSFMESISTGKFDIFNPSDSKNELQTTQKLFEFSFKNNSARTYVSEGNWLGNTQITGNLIIDESSYYHASFVDLDLFLMNIWNFKSSSVISITASRIEKHQKQSGFLKNYGTGIILISTIILSRLIHYLFKLIK